MAQAFIQSVCVLILLTATVTGALAEKRVALIIGNSAYSKVERLDNPANDATKLAQKLKAIGFDTVTLKLDLTYGNFRQTLRQFSRVAAGADVAAIYFAGHGIEVNGTNYLIPTDARLAHVDDVEFEALPLSTVMTAINRAGKLKLVILDACRNNPFKQSMASTGSTRSIGRGLARVSPEGSDTLIAYAAKEGTVAADGTGNHSPYARALLKHLSTPGIDVRLLFGRVRDEVLASTGRKQEPFTYGSLGGQSIYLKPPAAQGNSVPDEQSKPAADKETIFWTSIKASTDPAVFEAYLKQFPDGTFAVLAKLRLQALTQKEANLAPKQQIQSDQRDTAPQADQRSAAALTRLADTYRLGRGVAQSDAEALNYYRKAARMGYPRAQYSMALMYTEGRGVTRSDSKAVQWYLKAAENGYLSAMHNLANNYKSGTGVSRSYGEAARWYRKAADGGHAKAMFELAYAYNLGRGVTKNDAEAVRWYHKAADLGNAHAKGNLSMRYFQGRGVKKDVAKSARLAKAAAAERNLVGMYTLGYFHDRGIEVSRDPQKAAELVFKAVKRGYAMSKQQMLNRSHRWSREFRRAFQHELQKAGVYDGPLDGSFGPATRAAIRRLSGQS
ncbi:MAG: caspase family protein [Hyphomicrobiales bacterium]|nr:caspase family protein [Hyphomicrobiales bacterium]